MKKIVAIISILLLIPAYSFAQARNASVSTISHEGRTNVSNLGVTGLNVNGNPGYLVLSAAKETNQDQVAAEWYIWVDPSGDLCMASHNTIVNYSSFPTGNWADDGNFGKTDACGMGGTKVGSQS